METTATKTGYKQTKLGVIPEEWELKKLESFGEFLKGKGVAKKAITSSGNPCLTYGEIYTRHHYAIIDFKSFIDDDEAQNSRLIQKGDLLFASSGETLEDLGKCVAFIGDFPAYAGGDIIILRQSHYDAYFLGYLLNHETVRKQIYALGQGHSVVHVYASTLKSVEVPLPPLPEQKAIAQCLGTWDRGIRLLTELIEQKELRKKGLMQQLLTGKKRLEGFSGEWREVKLGDIASRVTRRNEELNDNVVTISAKRGFVRQEEFFNKRVASSTLSNYYLVHKGEFAYNKSYSNGYPMGAFKRLEEYDKAVVTTLYICFKINEGTDADFIKYYFEGGRMIQGLMKIANEGGRAHGLLNVGINDFLSLKLVLPQEEEQTAIAQVLQSADKEIQLLQAKLDLLKEQKKGLMQQLLTGKKRLGVRE